MKKLYMQPCVEIVTTHPFVHLCQISGRTADDSGEGLGEEDLAKHRKQNNDEDSWGNLW